MQQPLAISGASGRSIKARIVAVLSQNKHRSHRTPWRFGTIILFTGLLNTPASAGEAPDILVTTQSTHTVYTATPASSALPGFKPHINFPYMKQRADGTLVLDYTVGQTQSGAVFGMRAFSSDGGRNWGGFLSPTPAAPNAQLVKPVGQSSLGVSFSMSSGGSSAFLGTRFNSSDGGASWPAVNCNFNTGTVSYTSLYNNYQDIVQAGSLMLTTGYGLRVGSTKQELVLFSSADGGANWSRRASVATYDSDPLIEMGSEGPSEGSVIQLDNGKLLSVFRTGQPFPSSDINATGPALMWSMSSDLGQTWSRPKTLGVAGVFPTLRKLADGNVALSYGRYGAKLMFADAAGLRWTKPSVIYNGPGSGHTELRPNSDGTYAFVYDQSSFFPPSYNASPPAAYTYDNQQSANMKSAVLTITPTASTDDYNFAAQYHGDVPPDQASPAWTKSTAGSPTQRYSAYLGQDYIEMYSGNATDTAVYSLESSNTAWQKIDLAADGVVVDFRARVVGGTSAEGAADVFAGDSAAAVTVQLAATGVFLEGAGGNAAQAAYPSSASFLTTAWHDYRLVVKPDPTAGFAPVARVYLDGNYVTPILSRPVGAAGTDALQFGDRSPSAGGVLDLDFIRFSGVNSHWNIDGDGSINSLAAWDTTIPNGIDAVAMFGNAITAPRVAALAAPITLGRLLFDSDFGYTVAGSGTISMRTTAGFATLNLASGSHIVQPALRVMSDAIVNGSGALKLSSLSIDPGKTIDLGLARMVLDYAGASPIAMLQTQIGDGDIYSSLASATVTIGLAEATETAFAGSVYGLPLDSSAVIFRLTLRGDADLNGIVDLDDFTRLASGFGSAGRWATGDFDYDGGVSLDDFTALAANFGQVAPAGFASRPPVPEPSAAWCAGMILVLILYRRG